MYQLEQLPLVHSLLAPVPLIDTSWHSYVRAPNSSIIYPARIINTAGNVTGADNLLLPGDAFTTLSRLSTSSEIPGIVVDFGQNVVGYPIFSFTGASENYPGIRVAFSETIEYLSDVSDFSRSYNVSVGCNLVYAILLT